VLRKSIAPRLIVTCSAGLVLLMLGRSGFPQWKPTNVEMQLLPQYCYARFEYGVQRKHPVVKKWMSVFGEDWLHVHHWCAGLNFLRRAESSFGTDSASISEKRGNTAAAQRNFQYMIVNVDATWPLWPPLLVKSGDAFALQKQYAEALKAYRAAIARKPNYSAAWAALSDVYKKLDAIDDARGALTKGLKYSPNSRLLKRKLKRLDKP